MAFETDAGRLAMIKAVGGEQFDTGQTDSLWAVFDREFYEADVDGRIVTSSRPVIECRSSDVASHELVKGSPIRRLADDSQFVARQFEPDGTGMTRIRMSG